MIWESAHQALAEQTRAKLPKNNESWQPAPAGADFSLGRARDLRHGLLRFLRAPMELCPADDSCYSRLDRSATTRTFRRALDLMRKGIDEGRAALFGPRSPESAEASLEKALVDFQDDQAPGEWTRILILGRAKALDLPIQQEIFLIAQEALINARKHSEATRVEIEIEYAPRKVRVVVRDNGVGIDPQLLLSGGNFHFGLTGMRERAANIGATIRVWSKRGGGTEVEISLPISRKTPPSAA